MKFNVLCLLVYFKDFKRDAKRARFVNSNGRTKLHKIIQKVLKINKEYSIVEYICYNIQCYISDLTVNLI